MRGNVIELAIGLTVGTAFTTFVQSLVDNLILPPIGLLLTGDSFESLFIALNGENYATLADASAAEAPIIAYGQVMADLLDAIIIALVIFYSLTV